MKMDDGKRLQKVRDGQELDYGAAISLLQAMGVNSVLGGQQEGEGEMPPTPSSPTRLYTDPPTSTHSVI